MVGRCCCLRLASITFIMRVSFSTSTLAYMLDSLVRVSRRDSKNYFSKIAQSYLRQHWARKTKDITHEMNLSFTLFDSTSPHFASLQRTNKPLPQEPQEPFDVTTNGNGLATSTALRRHDTFLPRPSQRFQVFWLSFQSAFHLSFTVLVRYRFPIGI